MVAHGRYLANLSKIPVSRHAAMSQQREAEELHLAI
jgi:hypothetical protein